MRPELEAKVNKSIERLKAFEPTEGYYLAFSGGKDSVVCKKLCDMAGVKYEAVYRVTSVDPPELVRFIRDQHPDVRREVPIDKDGKPITMWSLIRKKHIMPLRTARYCCSELKEGGGDGRMVITGVRWAESPKRRDNQGQVTIMTKKPIKALEDSEDFRATNRGGLILINDNAESRKMVEQCYVRHRTTVNPIIEWEDADIWEFIRENHIPYCSLYDEGFKRLGCIGCPLTTQKNREAEFKRWPKYELAYKKAMADTLIWLNANRPSTKLTTVKDWWNAWMEYDVLPGQIEMELEDDDI